MKPQMREFTALMERRKWSMERERIVPNEFHERNYRKAVFRWCNSHSDEYATEQAEKYKQEVQELMLKKLSMNL